MLNRIEDGQSRPDVSEDILPGDIFDPWKVEILSPDQLNELPVSQKLEYLCRFGVLAPTTHNTVPQRFEIDSEGSRIGLYIDRSFVLPASDRKGRQAVVSLGAVAENITQAADAYRLQFQVEAIPLAENQVYPLALDSQSPRFVQVATVDLDLSEKVSSVNPNPLTVMLKRKTQRAEYDGSPLPDTIQSTLMEMAGQPDLPNVNLYLLQQSILNMIGRAQEAADSFVVNMNSFKTELVDWLIPNSDRRNPRGMRLHEFGLEDKAADDLLAALTGKRLLLPQDLAGFTKAGFIGIKSASALAVLTVDTDTVVNRFRVGQAFERMVIYLTQQGYSTAMHAAVTEVDWAAAAFNATYLRTQQRPTAVFRIGKIKNLSDTLRPHAARPQLADLLLTRP